MKLLRYINLRTKLFLISVGMVFAFGLVVLTQFENGLKQQKEGVIEGFSLYSDGLSTSVTQVFYSQYHNVQAFAKNEGLKQLEQKDSIKFILNEIITLYPLNDLLIVTDLNGNVVTSSDINSKGEKLKVENILKKNFSDAAWKS